ncbi:hypothetical protein [Desmospora profundinema]|uniref:Uncharacterized protein n=1 Tax=Desmospora profundinema TaxID=1571184 RepID=A0ABU1ISL6_9BACL|nr:hypothetical protein [Desmospora profundinema]MDR6227557.1 hypothetical protein [Desmospora profundinema]
MKKSNIGVGKMNNLSKLVSVCMTFLLAFGLLFTPHVQASDLDDEIFEEEEYVDYYVEGTEDDEEDDSELTESYSINSGEYGAKEGRQENR